MANSTSNQLDRSRPSSRVKSQGLLESTPILFRLPSVQVHPLPMVAELPSATLQVAQAESEAPSAVQPASPPVSIETQPTAVVEEKQSWWEHWSSGIVLVVLLVALYVTSILVIKNRAHKSANTLASDKAEFGDLANIEVPQIDSQPTATSLPTENSNAELALPALTLESLADTKARADELVGSISNQSETELGPANLVTADGGRANTDSTTTGDSLTSALSPPLATAQLLEPTQMPTALPVLQSGSTSSGNSAVSAQSVSSPIGQSPALYDGAANRAESGLPSGGLDPAMALRSDSALPGLAPLPPLSSNSTAASMNTVPSGSGLPAYSQGYSQPASTSASIPNSLSGSSQLAPVASTVSTQQSATGSLTGSTGPRLTSTPDANGEVEAIIRAYLELMRTNPSVESAQQSATTAPANRYQPIR